MKRFTLTEDHVKLLRAAWIGWEDCEYGAPAIDCKRPYGNSSVALDIAEILGWEWPDEYAPDYDEIYDELSERAYRIHSQTRQALQVILATGSFEPGEYVSSSDYSNDYKRV